MHTNPIDTKIPHRLLRLLPLLLSFLLLAGCGVRPGAAVAPEPTPVPTVRPTPAPTPSPTPCPHLRWEDGSCVDCGEPCDHIWENGVCSRCLLVCAHERHDAETAICSLCGEKTVHRYRDGLCAACGREVDFTQDLLPAECFTPCERQGHVETYDYRYFYPSGYEAARTLDIYLPYNYDPAQRYNVMVLIHGGGGSSHDFTETVFENEELGYSFCMKDLYDQMMAQKLCEPFIIVSPYTCSFRDPQVSGYLTDLNFAAELRECILPYIAETYSTYAASGSETDLQSARDHFGIGGVSNGSLYAFNAGMDRCLDLFSNFICLSGNDAPKEIAVDLNAENARDLPIRLFYAGCGDQDFQHSNSLHGFEQIVEATERLESGKNSFYVDVHGYHNWSQWAAHIYNALPLAFPPEG